MIGNGFVATRVVALPSARGQRIDAIRSELEAETRILGYPPYAYLGQDALGNWELAVGSEQGASLGLSLRGRFVQDSYIWIERAEDGQWAIVEVENGLPILEIEGALQRDFARVRVSAGVKPVLIAKSQKEQLQRMFGSLTGFDIHELDIPVFEDMVLLGELVSANVVTQRLIDWYRVGIIGVAVLAFLGLGLAAFSAFLDSREEIAVLPNAAADISVSQHYRQEMEHVLQSPLVSSALGLVWRIVTTIPAEAPGWRVQRVVLEDGDSLKVTVRPNQEFSRQQDISDAIRKFSNDEGIEVVTRDVGADRAYFEFSKIVTRLGHGRGMDIREKSEVQVSADVYGLVSDLALEPDELSSLQQANNLIYVSGEWEMPMRTGAVLWLKAATTKFEQGPELLLRRLDISLQGFKITRGSISMSHVLKRIIDDTPIAPSASLQPSLQTQN